MNPLLENIRLSVDCGVGAGAGPGVYHPNPNPGPGTEPDSNPADNRNIPP